MKPQWESQLEQLNSAFQMWENTYSSLPATFSFQGHTVQVTDLNTSFAEIVGMVQLVVNSEDINPILLVVNQSGTLNAIPNISQAISSLPNNNQANLEQLVNALWTIYASLVWIIPQSTTEYFRNRVQDADLLGKIESLQTLTQQIATSSENAQSLTANIKEQQVNAEIVLGKLTEYEHEAANAKTNAETSANAVAARLELDAQGLLSTINGYEREAANAKTNAEASAASAATNRQNITALLTELENGLTQQKDLLEKINLLSERAELVLEGTSKAGLAASFGNRKESLQKAQMNWGIGFFFGITLLIAAVVLTTTGILQLAPIMNVQGQIDAWAVIARVLITGPAVWFTWFAARQYGHTMRLIEDYAFKEASALAFVGYKREMGEDAEMIKLLRETAIKNFGASPTRMLAKAEPSSPIHELVDKALENQGFLEKLVDLIKAMKPGKD